MPSPYDYCPCGSGKKFRWCCQAIYPAINRAQDLYESGQHEAGLRAMDEATRKHPDHPEVWGQKANLLFSHGQTEEAEKALDKAFELFPNYPYGNYLRAIFRMQEGEIGGALLLARRAAEHYHSDATDYLSQVYGVIFECEHKSNRPVAARAALRLIRRFQPADEEVQKAFDNLFGPQGSLPRAARQDYALLSPDPQTEGPRRQAWDQALQQAGTPKLTSLARAFEELTQQDANDRAAWFNLGLTRAWLGENGPALEALDRYIEQEPDEERAASAAALAEVLRCGRGQEEASQYCAYSLTYQIRNAQRVQNLLNNWIQARRLLPLQTNQENMIVCLVLETAPSGLIMVGSPGADFGRYAGNLLIAGPILSFSSTLRDAYERIREELRQSLSIGLGELREQTLPPAFSDMHNEAMIYPFTGDAPAKRQRLTENMRRHYEEIWLHRPHRSLAGNAPVDAAGHPVLRKKLRGLIQFLEDCAAASPMSDYDFNSLRRKLGLLEAAPATSTPGGPEDILAKGAAELATLKPEDLSDEQLEQACQAAQKLDAGELAAHFARGLISRPVNADRPDRFPCYSFLIQHALDEGNLDAALDHVNEGERVDCEHMGGQHRNDYELRRGQVHVRRGEGNEAANVFQRLIDRVPNNPRYRADAAEGMLSAGQPERALQFAEAGIEVARAENDRDTEHHLRDLAESAKRR
jgi:tetratricopeptide (TPR) repeat protein